MTAAPTPGPWHVPESPWWQIVPANALPGDTAIAVVEECVHSGRDSHEAAANARLIAAAPDLLEAAAYLLGHADNDPDTGLDAHTYAEAWEMLEKAVDKAEGAND